MASRFLSCEAGDIPVPQPFSGFLKQRDLTIVLTTTVPYFLRHNPLVKLWQLEQTSYCRFQTMHGHDALEQNPQRHDVQIPADQITINAMPLNFSIHGR